MRKVGVIGANGYAGHELLKLLKRHEGVELAAINSRRFAGTRVRELYPDFDDDDVYTGYSYEEINGLGLKLLFLALPAGSSREVVDQLDERTKVVDLSPDYRFDRQAVYGLPELHREAIQTARLVANPGCYATACLLAALPIHGYANRFIFDCLSGWSGAGRESAYAKDPAIIKDNVVAYHLTRHRHQPEIQQFLTPPVSFTPHVIDTFQGMMATGHILLDKQMTQDEALELYQAFYRNAPFVRVQQVPPEITSTRQTNLCRLGGFEIDESNQLVVVSTIDNLWKGAAGQAVQNMNLMLGMEERAGLTPMPA